MDSVSLLAIILGIAGLCVTCFGIGFALGQAVQK
jgi:hypothetical protein